MQAACPSCGVMRRSGTGIAVCVRGRRAEAALDEVREDDAVLADAAVAELLQVVRGEGVVRIDEDHKLAARPVESRVAGRLTPRFGP